MEQYNKAVKSLESMNSDMMKLFEEANNELYSDKPINRHERRKQAKLDRKKKSTRLKVNQ